MSCGVTAHMYSFTFHDDDNIDDYPIDNSDMVITAMLTSITTVIKYSFFCERSFW